MKNCYLLKRCQDLNFFLRSKQLASDEIYRAIILVIEFPDPIIYTE